MMKKLRLTGWMLVACMALGLSQSCMNTSGNNGRPLPTKGQLAMIERKYGMFLHFGINTYLNAEWSDGTAPASVYAPPADIAERAAEWVKNAKKAGMRSIVLTTKHHDGFCLWDSKYTEHDVANPAIVNKVDIVKAVSDACQLEGLAFSVYYSLWDRHEPSYKADDKLLYIEYMKNQLGELMTNYGPVYELWLDGVWDRKKEDWHLQEIYDYVKSLQPDCQVSTNWTLGKRPVDMREGDSILYYPADFRLWDPHLPMKNDPKIYTYQGRQYYLPFESTQTISVAGNWFNHPEDTVMRDVEDLEEIFYAATTNDNCLLLNIPPDKYGIQHPKAIENVMKLARLLHIENGKPFPAHLRKPGSMTTDAVAEASSIYKNDTLHNGPQYAVDSDVTTAWLAEDSLSTLTVTLARQCVFDSLFMIIGENSIRQYVIEMEQGAGKWISVYQSGQIPLSTQESFMGYGILQCKLENPLETSRFRIRVLQSNGTPSIYTIKLKND